MSHFIGIRESMITNAEMVNASAGTGKTYQLSNRFLSLLLRGEKPWKILATTFTKKAASEIRERVVHRLAIGASSQENEKLLLKELGLTQSPISARDALSELLNNQHRLWISTLDSFFSRILRSFSLECGLPWRWTIADRDEENNLYSFAIETLLSHESRLIPELLRELSQRESKRSVHLRLYSHFRNSYDLFRDSSRSAWFWLPDEDCLLEENLQQLISEIETEELPRNKNASPNQLWQKARAGDLVAARHANWHSFIKGGLAGAVRDGKEMFSRQAFPPVLFEKYKMLLTHARASLTEQLKRRTGAAYRLLEAFDIVLTDLKLQRGVLQHADITQILSSQKQMESLNQLYFRLDAQISHILLDEFQDTSRQQWAILEPQVEEILSKTSIENTFFCVGDVKQAIYGWRGGVAELSYHLPTLWPVIEESCLTTSYRSSTEVINLVNKVFPRLSTFPGLSDYKEALTEWMRGFELHSSIKTGLRGYTALIAVEESEQESNASNATLKRAARLAVELTSSNPCLCVGVLFRRNDRAEEFSGILSQDYGLSIATESSRSLLASGAVRLISALLSLTDHPQDLISRFKLVNSAIAEQIGLTDLGDDKTASELAQSIRRKIYSIGLGKTVSEYASIVGEHCRARERASLDRLVEAAYSYNEKIRFRTKPFLSFLSTYRLQEGTNSQIRIMTIHQAKGLEFDAVILAELEDKLLGLQRDPFLSGREDPLLAPNRIAPYTPEEVRELIPDLKELADSADNDKIKGALSVLYVALTRAIYATYMVIPQKALTSEAKNFASALCHALEIDPESQQADEASDSIVWHEGAPDWSSYIESTPALETGNIEVKQAKDLHIAGPVVKQFAALPRHRTASMNKPAMTLSSELNWGRYWAKSEGQILHRFMQEVGWIEDGLPQKAHLLRLASEMGSGKESASKLVVRFFSFFNFPDIRVLFSREACSDSGKYEIDLYRELPFALKDKDGGLVAGRFDRLVLRREGKFRKGVQILDFKFTSHTQEESLSPAKIYQAYSGQLETYKRSAAGIFRMQEEDVNCLLVLPEIPLVIPITIQNFVFLKTS